MEYIGKNISLLIEGESHTKEIKLKISGLKPSKLDFLLIDNDLKRRNPKLFFNTQRKEEDNYEIISGIENSNIINDCVEAVFKNNSFNSNPYIEHDGFLRPSHSDYVSLIKYNEIKPGSGSFSGRMTLPMCFAGSIFKQLLGNNTKIYSRIKSVGPLEDEELDLSKIDSLNQEFPVQSEKFKENSFNLLKECKENKDSIGGVVEIVVLNPDTGLGDNMFESLEGKISKLLFSIPAVKGIEFGDGFLISKHYGSEVLDKFILSSDKIVTDTNHNGGINGGISNGMPIIFRVAIKPTPTIGKPIESLNYKTKMQEKVIYGGDHDSFIVNRAIPVIEGLTALALLDEMYEKE